MMTLPSVDICLFTPSFIEVQDGRKYFWSVGKHFERKLNVWQRFAIQWGSSYISEKAFGTWQPSYSTGSESVDPDGWCSHVFQSQLMSKAKSILRLLNRTRPPRLIVGARFNFISKNRDIIWRWNTGQRLRLSLRTTVQSKRFAITWRSLVGLIFLAFKIGLWDLINQTLMTGSCSQHQSRLVVAVDNRYFCQTEWYLRMWMSRKMRRKPRNTGRISSDNQVCSKV